MNNTLSGFLVGVVLGAVIQTVLTLIFEDFFRLWKQRLVRRIRWLCSRFQNTNHLLGSHEHFRIGKWKMNWIVLEGTSDRGYREGDIVCQLEPVTVQLPNDLQTIRSSVHNEQEKHKRDTGSPVYYNGPMVAFSDLIISRTSPSEDPLLFLRFKNTDYYSFLATSMSLNQLVPDDKGSFISVRDKYLRGTDYRKPVAEIATSFAVNLAVVTKDGYLVIGKRGQRGISCYPGCYTVPVNECVHPKKDAAGTGYIDVFRTAKRGINEELNVEAENNEIVFFTLGLDTEWYFYALTGMLRSGQFTKDDIIARMSRGAKDKWETTELYYLQFNPAKVAKELRNMGTVSRWHPVAFVCVIQTLIHEFGRRSVERAFKSLS